MAGVSISIIVILSGQWLEIPRSSGLAAIPFALLLMLGVRYLRRLITQARQLPKGACEPTLIYGAGELGSLLARRMLSDTRAEYFPVGFVDDDPNKRNLQLHSVRVLGSIDDLSPIVEQSKATVIVVAFGEAEPEQFRSLQQAAEELGLRVKVMPSLNMMLQHGAHPGDLRDISIEDLLGRAPNDTGVESVAGYLKGRRVLVTGAGGSIGSELCAQIVKFAPAELIMLDRDETGLQQTQIAIAGHGLLDTKDVVLADIRDAEAIKELFARRAPEVVFHAAALKHLPMLEQYPDEAWKSNVIGTFNVLEAARLAGVNTFINISTDKAANPSSVLGYSKRLAEKLTAWYGDHTKQRYLSVRFGNVIGSRGSMLPTFTKLIEQGGPVTVTHPDVTRYFMTIPEACQLVMQAGGIGGAGEVLILDMGEPVNILAIAKRMIAMSGKDIEIVFTGLREGEKLHEELVEEQESVSNPFHPKIAHANAGLLAPADLEQREWDILMKRRSGSIPVEELIGQHAKSGVAG
ncbi:MAG: polysaccharide biosynthesis protein [Gulosibacter sp.]|uniref:polysaccharide biosynthesis protein n=1 Tax=Gulosibacter sp. TaxID=2817531 RepID=UPI003F919232